MIANRTGAETGKRSITISLRMRQKKIAPLWDLKGQTRHSAVFFAAWRPRSAARKSPHAFLMARKPDRRIGGFVGNYFVEAMIGWGGSSKVYRVRHTDTLQHAAMKVISKPKSRIGYVSCLHSTCLRCRKPH